LSNTGIIFQMIILVITNRCDTIPCEIDQILWRQLVFDFMFI